MKKKALSLALALALCLGLTVPAFAAEPADYEYRGVYRLTNVTYVEENYDGFGYGRPISCNAPAEITLLRDVNVDVQQITMSESEFGEDVFEEVPGIPNRDYSAGTKFQLKEPGDYAFSFMWEEDLLTNWVFVLVTVDDKDISEPSTQPTTPPQPQQPAGTKTANPTNDKLAVDGVEQTPTVYKIGGSNYFKIRDVAAVLNGTEKQFAVGYSGGKVTVTSGRPYEATGKELAGAPVGGKDASTSNDAIVINGVEASLTVYKIGGSNYFKLRDLGEALNFYVGWEAGRGVYIETGKPYSK